ncbi:pentatricopeptide repeat-containing protein At1g61870, mitochondrial [Punica granatum]|uniref:Pentatricopeptide repeat-containing protein At1g61870, mitochondrial n=1 Tax=Punica granatum TaxID=22663 RepID=A0A6P8DK64_PUNGR|nr:pentatricopeptide repeat-containing protein At1g61870, mitochondrial [Punica granatum]
MSVFGRLRSTSSSLARRHFSSILNPNTNTPLSSKEKSRVALSLLKSEKSPDRIIDICRAAALTPESQLDRIAYSVAISNLSRSNHFEGIRQFLEESKARPDLRTERFFSHAIVLYGQAKMIADGINTFKQIEELGVRPTVKSLNALLFACILAKDFKELKRIYIDFPKVYGIQPDLETYNHVIKAFAESKSTSSAYSILAEMKNAGVMPNATTFHNMLAGFYGEEKFEDVEKVLKLMEEYKVPRSRSTYNVRIQSLCKLKKSDDAKELLDMMLLRGKLPNCVTYKHLIHGFCKEGKLEEGKKLFKDMKRRGIGPDSDCYFTLVYYLCEGKDFEAALGICKESMEKGWFPNLSTMKLLVNGLASIDKVEEAKEIVRQVKEKFPKTADLWDEVEASLPQ